MNDLEAIGRDLRLSVDVLKRPAELLKQGYEPAFLGTYRHDELGQMDINLLARLKRGLEYRDRLAKFKEKVKAAGHTEGWWHDSLQPLIDVSQSIAEVDGVTRNVRSRKSSRIMAQKDPRLSKLGEAILTLSGPAPADLNQWAAEQLGVSVEEAPRLLNEAKHWLQALLSEDAELIHRLGRQILKRSSISVTMLADQPEKQEDGPENDAVLPADSAEASSATAEAAVDLSPEIIPSSAEEESLAAAYDGAEVAHEDSPVMSDHEAVQEAFVEEAAVEEAVETDPTAAETETSATAEVPVPANVETDKLLASFGSKPARGPLGKVVEKKVKSVTLKQLSPRQRRRRWLRSILQRYSKLKKPLHRLSDYQALMLGRGQRSQIVTLKMDYDRQPLIKMAREAFCPGQHPLHGLLMDIADEALSKVILPKLEHDVFLEIEEAAHQELIEMAVRHLQEMLQRRPVRGHRILVIDAMGPKTAAVAIVGPQGQVEFTGDLSAVSGRPDVVAQNVATLGQWIHQYKVSLVAISNGNTRRYLIHSVNELMKQSGEGSLRWTIVDRTGADAYCDTRQSLRELPKIAKRHRASVWLAWRLQDPLIELTKVDPARLRLGSYQRELPQDILEQALESAVSAAVAARGIDVWYSHEKALVCLPGVDPALAKAIVGLRDAGEITNREALSAKLQDKTTESRLRQAIGYLRVFGSDQTLDGTMIHPDDYRLAERLIATGEVAAPPAAPENWKRPDMGPAVEAVAPAVPQEPVQTEVVAEVAAEPVATADSVSGSDESVAVEASTEPNETLAAVESVEPLASNDPESAESETTSAAASSEADDSPSTAPAVESLTPENPTGPTLPPPLKIDVEKLARGWQVGREKMRMVARCLQQPFADSRDANVPIPLMTQVPTLENLQPGSMAWGIVVGVADFGAFVDLGPDCNGLIHVSRLSREFVEDPHEVVQMGELLQVWVLHVDAEKKRIALSALPPGVEQARRPSSHDGQHDGQGRPDGDRGRQDNRQGGGRPRYQDRNGPRRDGPPGQSGQRSGAPAGGQSNQSGPPRGGQGRPPFGQRQGQSGQGAGRSGGGRGNDRGRPPRRHENADGADNQQGQARAPRPNKPPKPAPPITDAMQQGIEPMRTFSDLLQFYQVKRENPPEQKPVDPPSVEPAKPEPSSTNEANDSKPASETESNAS